MNVRGLRIVGKPGCRVRNLVRKIFAIIKGHSGLRESGCLARGLYKIFAGFDKKGCK